MSREQMLAVLEARYGDKGSKGVKVSELEGLTDYEERNFGEYNQIAVKL